MTRRTLLQRLMAAMAATVIARTPLAGMATERAQTYRWAVADGNWDDPACWRPYGVPGRLDTAILDNGGHIRQGVNGICGPAGTLMMYSGAVGGMHRAKVERIDVTSGFIRMEGVESAFIVPPAATQETAAGRGPSGKTPKKNQIPIDSSDNSVILHIPAVHSPIFERNITCIGGRTYDVEGEPALSGK